MLRRLKYFLNQIIDYLASNPVVVVVSVVVIVLLFNFGFNSLVWNDGYCSSCGGAYEYMGRFSSGYTKYYYVCPDCGNIIHTILYYNPISE